MSITYSQSVRWTGRDGNVSVLTVNGYPTAEAAAAKAFHDAREFGWTPPRWWQWWRKGDTRAPAQS